MVKRLAAWCALAVPCLVLAQGAQPSLEDLARDSHVYRAAPETVIDQAWLERAQRAGEVIDPAAVSGIQEQGRALIEQAVREAAGQSGIPRAEDAPGETSLPLPRYRLFVSQSMGEGAFKDVLALAERTPDLELVLRGVLPGQTLVQFYQRVTQIRGGAFKEGDAIPRITIDPPAFLASAVQAVPQLERLDEAGATLASVRGVTEPDWIERELAGGKTGDLGAWGATTEIGELDMLEQFKAEAAKIDYAAIGEDARDRFWQRAAFLELPRATEPRVREVDPTIVVTDDVLTPDGYLIARKGDRINPLETIGFTQTLLVIDATDAGQVGFARTFASARPNEVVTVITTAIDRERSWDGFAELEHAIGRPLFLLFDDVRTTFKLERVPTVVVAKGNVFAVIETPIPASRGQDAGTDPSKE